MSYFRFFLVQNLFLGFLYAQTFPDLTSNTPRHPENPEIQQIKVNKTPSKRYIILGSSNPLVKNFNNSPVLQRSVVSEIEHLTSKVSEKVGESSIKGSTKLASVALFIETTESKISELKRDGLNIIEDEIYHITLEESLQRTKIAQAWNLNDNFGNPIKGRNIRIGIIDTGVDHSHPAFGACTTFEGCQKFGGGYDFVYNDPIPDDKNGHGTHVAGIAAGIEQGYSGVAPEATLYAIKVLGDDGLGYLSSILAGLDYSLDPNRDGSLSDRLDIVNLSLGGPGGSESILSQAVDNLVSAGVVAVVAAGNSGHFGGYSISSPGSSINAITVGATFKQNYPGQNLWGDQTPTEDEVTPFSSIGPSYNYEDTNERYLKPDLVAPGAIVCAPKSSLLNDPSTCSPGRIGFSGTSMSSPHVAGVAALILQKNPFLSPFEIKDLMRRTARKLPESLGRGVFSQGFGLMDAEAATRAAEHMSLAKIKTRGRITGGEYPITGTAKAHGFLKYELAMKLDSDWQILSEGRDAVDDGILGRISLPVAVEDSFIWLRLKVYSLDSSENEVISEDYAILFIDGTNIYSPRNYDREDVNSWYPLSGKKEIRIIGSASGSDFLHYDLSVCPKNSEICFTLESNKPSKVENGVLGIWKPFEVEGIKSGFWIIKLRVVGNSGTHETNTEVYLDTQLMPNFPLNTSLPCIASEVGYWATFSCLAKNQPTVADLNNDGVDELGFANGSLIMILNSDGVPLPGWPKVVPSCERELSVSDFNRGITFSDFNNDGVKEIVAGDICGRIHIFNIDGSSLRSPIEVENREISSIAVSDIDHDGLDEMIFTSNALRLHVMRPDGSELFGFPKELPPLPPFGSTLGNLIPAPLVLDLLPSFGKEIVIATRSCIGGGTCSGSLTDTKGDLWVIDSRGETAHGFPKRFEGRIFSPTAFDIDGSGVNDILFLEKLSSERSLKVHSLSPTGTELPNFPILIPHPSNDELDNTISAGDLDGDGSIELVFFANNCVYVYENNGLPMENFPFCIEAEDLSEYQILDYPLTVGEPLLANLDDDYRTLEIAVPVFRYGTLAHGMNEVLILDHQGRLISTQMMDSGSASLSLALIRDGTGFHKILGLSQRMNLYKWDSGSCGCEAEPWEQSRGGHSKTGVGNSSRMCMGCVDECLDDPLKLKPGLCGCGIPDNDSDGDLIPDCLDRCPNDPLKSEPGLCGCGVEETGNSSCREPRDYELLPDTTPEKAKIKTRRDKIRVIIKQFRGSDITNRVEIVLKVKGKKKKTLNVEFRGEFYEIKRPRKRSKVEVTYQYYHLPTGIHSKESPLSSKKLKARL